MRHFESVLKHFTIPNKVQLTNKGEKQIKNMKETLVLVINTK